MSQSDAPGTINGTIIYHYTPSLALAATFCAAFGLSTALHTYQTARTRSLYMIPILIGGICEVVGYIGRIVGADEAPEYTLAPYIVQAILLLIAPALIAASIYMTMGHIVRATNGDQYSLIRERILTKLFVIGDLMSFLVQSTGAAMLTKKEQEKKDAGNYIIIGGLVVQLLFFGFFMIVTVLFWKRLGSDKARSSQLRQESVNWRLHISVLFTASILIMVRSVFRVVEYAQGPDGYLLSHEMYLYIFDAALMLVTVALCNIVHPTEISVLNNGGKAIRWVFKTENVSAKATSEKVLTRPDEETAYSPIMHESRAID